MPVMIGNNIPIAPLSCPMCARGFWVQQDLDDHIRNDHERHHGF